MHPERSEYTNESDEPDNAIEYEELLVDQSADGEIYIVLKPSETPDPRKGTFVVIPASTRERNQIVGTQGDAYKKLGELNSRRR